MDCSMPDFPVLHCLSEFVQIHVYWVADAIHPSVAPFSSCPQSFPASGSFPMSHFFASGGQSTGALDSVLMNSHLPWPQNYFYFLHLGDKQFSSIWNWLCGIFIITGVHASAWMCVHVCILTHPPMCHMVPEKVGKQHSLSHTLATNVNIGWRVQPIVSPSELGGRQFRCRLRAWAF